MALLGRPGGHGSGHLGESQVEVARDVGFLHAPVSGQGRGNRQLLLRPIDVGHGAARPRLEEAAQPGRRPQDELAVARLIPPGPRPERGQQDSVAAVRPDGFEEASCSRRFAKGRGCRGGCGRPANRRGYSTSPTIRTSPGSGAANCGTYFNPSGGHLFGKADKGDRADEVGAGMGSLKGNRKKGNRDHPPEIT